MCILNHFYYHVSFKARLNWKQFITASSVINIFFFDGSSVFLFINVFFKVILILGVSLFVVALSDFIDFESFVLVWGLFGITLWTFSIILSHFVFPSHFQALHISFKSPCISLHCLCLSVVVMSSRKY